MFDTSNAKTFSLDQSMMLAAKWSDVMPMPQGAIAECEMERSMLVLCLCLAAMNWPHPVSTAAYRTRLYCCFQRPEHTIPVILVPDTIPPENTDRFALPSMRQKRFRFWPTNNQCVSHRGPANTPAPLANRRSPI